MIFLNNINGRDIIEKHVKELLRKLQTIHDIDVPKIIIKRGTSLMDFININNKKVLLGNHTVTTDVTQLAASVIKTEVDLNNIDGMRGKPPQPPLIKH